MAPALRDGWVDRVLGLTEVPDDGLRLPPECVPYLPCPVDALLRLVDEAKVGPSDVFVDVGAGVGRAMSVVHLLTGAAVVGLEVQPELLVVARERFARWPSARASWLEGDAAERIVDASTGTVFFLYCPFSGPRLQRVLDHLEGSSRERVIRVCCLDLPLPACAWLRLVSHAGADLAVYESIGA